MTVLLVEAEIRPGIRTDLAFDGERIVDPRTVPRPDRIVDLGGRAVLPGLVDHHLHLFAIAAADESIDLSPQVTAASGGFGPVLREARRRRPTGWLRAVGYDVAADGAIGRDDLDSLDVGPVRIQDRTGILWILDSRALDELGLLDDARPPEGVEMRDGRPTGRLFRLDRWLGRRIPRETPDIRSVGERLAARGIVAVTDAGADNGLDDLRAFAAADLPVAVTAMTRDPDTPSVDGVELGPVKILLDDADLPNLDELTDRIRTAHLVGRTVAVHCVTPVQLVLALTAGVGRRDRIEHASWVPADVLPLLVERDPTLVVQPGLVHGRGDRYLAENDPADLSDLHRLASLRSAGLRIAASSDAPYGDADPWTTISAATMRRTRAGAVFGPDEAVGIDTAVDLLTGSPHDPATPALLVPGADADLVIVDGTWAELGRRPRVLTTVRSGRRIAGSWPA